MSEKKVAAGFNKKGGRSARRRAREYALQGLYQWLLNQTDPETIDEVASTIKDYKIIDEDFYKQLFHGIIDEFVAIEETYRPHIDRAPELLSPIERAILLIGAYELKYTTTPYRVVINEAIELAKTFGGSEGFRYVNGVLDKMVPELRPHEVKRVAKP